MIFLSDISDIKEYLFIRMTTFWNTFCCRLSHTRVRFGRRPPRQSEGRNTWHNNKCWENRVYCLAWRRKDSGHTKFLVWWFGFFVGFGFWFWFWFFVCLFGGILFAWFGFGLAFLPCGWANTRIVCIRSVEPPSLKVSTLYWRSRGKCSTGQKI